MKDRAEFQRLAPEEVLTRWFEQIQKGRTRVFMQLGGSGLARREILGEVAETPAIVHVVFREIEPAPPVPALSFAQEPRIRVITTRRTPEGWRARLNGGLVFDEGGSWGIGYNDDDESEASPP